MFPFKQWLYERLIDEEIIDRELSLDDMTYDLLIESTELLDEDLDLFKLEYEESCSLAGCSPVWDLN